MFTIAVDRHPGQVRYTITGALGSAGAEQIRLAEEPAECGDVVVLELVGVTEVDDFGFGALVALVRRARERDARVVVITSEGPVRDRLVDSGLERLAASCERRAAPSRTADELVLA